MENKAIIWRRGSTDRQEIDTQDKDLTAMAIADGFKEEDLIHIGEAGASAIKQNDLYLQEVKKLISTLDSDQTVKTVYVWEISRLARVELAFYKMKDYFITNHIQLICKTPSLRLYDKDGTVNKGTELTLSLLVTLAKQEMEIKQERFKRAKERNKKEGKFNGGKIKIGYRLDKDKHFIPDDEKSKVVRDIFDWFVNGGLSLNKIQKRLVDMGVYHTVNPKVPCIKRVSYILRDASYKGNDIYPRIVQDNIWDAASEKLKGHSKPYETKNIYFCKGILRDSNGCVMTAKVGRNIYTNRHREPPININLNALDYIALYSANLLLAHYNASMAQTNKNEYKIKIDENDKLIKSKHKQIEEYEKANQRAIDMNIRRPEHFPTERLDIMLKANDKAIQSLKTDISDLHTENTRMQNWLDGEQQFINTITSGLSDERKREMILTVIDNILVTKLEDRHFKIEIKNKIGYIDNSWFDYITSGNKLTILHHLPYGETIDLSKNIKTHRRFTRKRYESPDNATPMTSSGISY